MIRSLNECNSFEVDNQFSFSILTFLRLLLRNIIFSDFKGFPTFKNVTMIIKWVVLYFGISFSFLDILDIQRTHTRQNSVFFHYVSLFSSKNFPLSEFFFFRTIKLRKENEGEKIVFCYHWPIYFYFVRS